jgi:hypothetical protein
MSRLEVPLKGRKLRATGDVLLRADLRLLVYTNKQAWLPLTFRLDSGAEITNMLASAARAADLPFPQQPMSGLTLTTASGQVATEVRAGLIRVQVVGLDGTQYVFPCYFLGDPNAPPPAQPRYLLGLGGVVDKLRFTIDGTPTLVAPHGSLIVEKK